MECGAAGDPAEPPRLTASKLDAADRTSLYYPDPRFMAASLTHSLHSRLEGFNVKCFSFVFGATQCDSCVCVCVCAGVCGSVAGGHAYSLDGFKWYKDETPAYSTTVVRRQTQRLARFITTFYRTH
jgi:hypothetical protein